MIPTRPGSISGWAARNRLAAKASGRVCGTERGLAAAPRTVPRAAHMSISSVAIPAAFRTAAWKSPRPSTPSEPWQITTPGASPGPAPSSPSLGVQSLPATVSVGSVLVSKAT